jgi:hypothetical protein
MVSLGIVYASLVAASKAPKATWRLVDVLRRPLSRDAPPARRGRCI